MVGVPGRSKGCAACCRQKKGCDLQRPECGRCHERGLVCAYDDDRVFVYHVFATPRPEVQNTSATRPTRTVHSRKKIAAVENNRRNMTAAEHSEIVLSAPLARSAYGEKSAEMFWDLYFPAGSAIDPGRSTVMSRGLPNVLPTLYTQDDALKTAVLALSSATVGRARDDQWMIEQGKKLYGRSLHEMKEALRDPIRSQSDALLAVPRVMGLFEILFGADMYEQVQANSWQSHAEGELALMKAGGPRKCTRGFAHQLFLDGRLHVAIAASRARRATVLSEEVWKTIPFVTLSKSPRDYLVDILVDIPGLLEDFDAMERLPYPKQKGIDVVITKWRMLVSSLDEWLMRYSIQIVHIEKDEPVPIIFTNPVCGHLTVLYWTVATVLYRTYILLPGTLQCEEKKHPRYYARRIARAVPFFLNPSVGIWGAVNIAFPAGCALTFLMKDSGDLEYCKLVFMAWGNPKLPMAIQKFLTSMRRESESSPLSKTKSEESSGLKSCG